MAQDAIRDLVAPEASAPSGFSGVPVAGGGFGDSWSDRALDGWTFGAASSMYYSSNISQSGRRGLAGGGGFRPGNLEDDDVVLTLSTSASYRSPNPDRWLGGSLNLGYAQYLNNDDFSGPVYGATIQGGIGGGRLTGSGNLGFNFNRGGNRNVGGFAEQISVNGSLAARYRYSPKTSLAANYSTNLISQESAGGNDTDSHRLSLTADWQATPLTSLGAGFAASLQSGSASQERTTLGPVVTVNYKLSQKIALNSSFGLDFVTGGAGDDDIGYDVRIGASYRASALWGMNLSLFGGTIPDNGFGGGFRDTWSVRLGYNRRILRSQLNAGISWETSTQNTANRPAANNGDRDFLSFDLSLSRPIPVIRGSGSIFFSWQDQSGNGSANFDGYTVGLSASTSF